MRSRTELVTTTFVDSEEDFTETDDSEEDWRPDKKNGKKRAGGRLKRAPRNRGRAKEKSISDNSTATANTGAVQEKRARLEYSSEDDVEAEIDENDDDESEEELQNAKQNFTIQKHEQNVPDKSGMLNLYLYKMDLDEDYKKNSHLCLWRRDGHSLLQKYIRVKTDSCEEFIFTSSSVYSSWDENRRKDFAVITVKCSEDNNRRVSISNLNELKILVDESLKCNEGKTSVGTTSISAEVITAITDDDDDDDDDYVADDADDENNSDNDDG